MAGSEWLEMSRFYEIEKMTSQYEAWWKFMGKVGLVGLNMIYMRRADHWFGYGIKIG